MPVHVIGGVVLLLIVYLASVALFNAFPYLRLHSNGIGKHQFRAYNAASRIMGTCHFLMVVPACTLSLYRTYPWIYSGANSELEIFVLKTSLAYFLADTYHFVKYERDDLPTLMHHLACIVFIAQVLYVGNGGEGAMVALFAGEITNPLHSLWYVSRQAENHALTALLSPWFTAAFTLFRVVILPIWSVDVCRGFVAGVARGDLGAGIASWWTFEMVCMLLGGIFWTYKVLLGFHSFSKKKTTAHKQ